MLYYTRRGLVWESPKRIQSVYTILEDGLDSQTTSRSV